jgi:hypothetical protein
MMELNEEFVTWMQLGITVIGLLSLFLIFINYNVNVTSSDQQRKTYYIGNYMLGSECLSVTDGNNIVKGLLSESKLDASESGDACQKYPNTNIIVSLIGCTRSKCSWTVSTSTPVGLNSASFATAVRMNDGSVQPAEMVVSI